MTAHTPGPWMIATSCSWRRLMTESGEHVCTPTVHSDGQPDLYFPNGGADGPDARLIAAAPELLEALKFFVAPFAGLEVVPDGFIAKARAAIAKAKGESDGR